MSQKNTEFPFKVLGVRLKHARQQKKESLAEVSGAVEIDVPTLSAIERGIRRPSEDILLLLISHFAIKDEDATDLWMLAGYDKDIGTSDDSIDSRQNVIVVPFDARVVYADMANVVANKYGIVMNFLQSTGPSGHPLAISRIGMSKEHAENILLLLQKALSAMKTNETIKHSLPSPKTAKGDSKS
jgi:transcriptional regulator with XRE-family HTH domain